MNILHRQVTRFTGVTNTTPQGTVLLFDYLTQPDPSVTPLLQRVRESKSPDELKANKKLLPCITPHGTFRQRNDSGLIAHSGLIQIDMDRKDNTDIPNWESIPDILKLDQHIAYVGKSASGSSFWGLIPVEDPTSHTGHWGAIQEHFMIQYGITLDPCTKALSHARFYAYDPDGYVNPDAVTFTKRIKTEPDQHRPHGWTDQRDMDKFKAYIRDICNTKTDITGGWKQWMKVGTAIKSELGISGEDAFIDICQFSPTFNEAECRRTYRTLKPNNKLKLGTFYFICREYGIEPEEYRLQRRIHRPRKPDSAPTSQKKDVSPIRIITGIQIARWMDESPKSVQPAVNSFNEDLHPTPSPPPPSTLVRTDRKTCTALLSSDRKLYIETPPSYHTFTVYSSIEAYNARSEVPVFISKEELNRKSVTVVLIELEPLKIPEPDTFRLI